MISSNLKKFASSPVKGSSGFTLLELLIVIAIIAILSIALVFMLNPAETLKKARDAQRISDLKSVKTALGIMLTASSTPNLDNFAGGTTSTFTTNASSTCLTNTAGAAAGTGARIAYSSASAPSIASNTYAGSDAASASIAFATTGYYSATAGKVDGLGWIPVNLKALTGGTPISSFPVDPTNTVSTTATSTDLVYRYACQNGSPTANPSKPAYIFEIDARLESSAYTSEDNKMAKDGGDNDNLYESGNSLNLLPSGTGPQF